MRSGIEQYILIFIVNVTEGVKHISASKYTKEMFVASKQVLFSRIRSRSHKFVIGNVTRSIGSTKDNGISKTGFESFDLSSITEQAVEFVNTPYFGLVCLAGLVPVYNIIMKKRAEPQKLEGNEFIKDYLAGNKAAVLMESGLVYHEMLRGNGNTQVTLIYICIILRIEILNIEY